MKTPSAELLDTLANGHLLSPSNELTGSTAATASASSVDWPWPSAEWMFMAASDAPKGFEKAGYYDFVYDLERAALVAPDASEAPLVLYLAAFSHYQLYVNGRFIRRGPAVGYTSLSFFDRQELDPAAFDGSTLRIAIRFFHEGTAVKTAQDFDYGQPALRVAIEQDGQLLAQSGSASANFTSDTAAAWRVRCSPEFGAQVAQLSLWGNFNEYWHADKVDAWQQPDFDVSGWGQAVALSPATDSPNVQALVQALRLRETPELTARPVLPQRLVCVAPQLGRIEQGGQPLHGLSAAQPWPGAELSVAPGERLAAPELTWDFGWVQTGHTEIELSGAAGVLEIYYGESLDTLRCDVLTFQAGETRWQSFHRRAFRFMKLRFIALEGRVQIRRVGLCETVYPYTQDVCLATGDASIDRYITTTRRTLAASTSHHYEDCPWREQALWLVDARVMALANSYLHGDHAVTAKSLRQLFALQREDGAVAATGPKDNEFYFIDFMLHLVPMLWEYYQVTGDRALLEDLREPVNKLSTFIDSWSTASGLLDSTGSAERKIGVFLDWSQTLQRQGCTTILNALYAVHLQHLAQLQACLGAVEESASIQSRIKSLREVARQTFYCEQAQLYRDGDLACAREKPFSMQANIAAVYAGFETGDRARSLLDRACFSGELQRPFGPSFYLFVFEAMHRQGMQRQIAAWIQDYWGAMLQRGATTWWEVLDPTRPEWAYPHPFLGQTPTYERAEVPVSHCHGWSCVPGYAIPRYLLGVDLSSIAQGKIRWQANTPALTDAVEYRVQTVAGPLHLKFQREGERYAMEVVESPLPVESY